MLSEIFCALFSSKIFWNMSAILETVTQKQSTAQLSVHLSNERGIHDNRDGVQLMLTHLIHKHPSITYQLQHEDLLLD